MRALTLVTLRRVVQQELERQDDSHLALLRGFRPHPLKERFGPGLLCFHGFLCAGQRQGGRVQG
eukprot:83219-Prymnesium_polylepis.1